MSLVRTSLPVERSAAALPTPAKFWDALAVGYARKPVPDEDAYERTLERVRARLTPNDSVLELGAGTGTTALKLAPSAREILGTDYSEQMTAIATAKAHGMGVPNVRFRTCTLDDPTLLPGSFDLVMAMNLLHLYDQIPTRLQRIRELVRTDGLFISKTPCLGDRGLAVRVLIPLMRAVGRAPYVNFVTERSLISDIEAAGFEIEESGMYPAKRRSFFIVARRV